MLCHWGSYTHDQDCTDPLLEPLLAVRAPVCLTTHEALTFIFESWHVISVVFSVDFLKRHWMGGGDCGHLYFENANSAVGGRHGHGNHFSDFLVYLLNVTVNAKLDNLWTMSLIFEPQILCLPLFVHGSSCRHLAHLGVWSFCYRKPVECICSSHTCPA